MTSTSNNVIIKLEEKKKQEKYDKYESHILHDNVFDYNNIDHINALKNQRVNLGDVFRYFSLQNPRILRYRTPTMPSGYTLHELNIRRKLHTLSHSKNQSNLSAGQKLSKIYTNKNLKHHTYSTQQHSNSTNLNSKGLERSGNSLLYKGQALNKVVTQKLHSSNGNQTFTFDPSHPLIGINKKYTHNTVKKHPLHKIKMPIL
jgi:hypothetical protein